MRYFSKDHVWIAVEGNTGFVGITDYAQSQLGDIVYVSLKKDLKSEVGAGEEAAEIESIKSVSPVISPVNGKIIEFNEIFNDESNSGIINKDPYVKGWIFKIELTDKETLNTLMNEEQYSKYIESL